MAFLGDPRRDAFEQNVREGVCSKQNTYTKKVLYLERTIISTPGEMKNPEAKATRQWRRRRVTHRSRW